MFEAEVQFVNIADVKNFCNAAMKADGKVSVISGHYCIDGASLMGLFSLDLTQPVLVKYDDEDFADAITAIRVKV